MIVCFCCCVSCVLHAHKGDRFSHGHEHGRGFGMPSTTLADADERDGSGGGGGGGGGHGGGGHGGGGGSGFSTHGDFSGGSRRRGRPTATIGTASGAEAEFAPPPRDDYGGEAKTSDGSGDSGGARSDDRVSGGGGSDGSDVGGVLSESELQKLKAAFRKFDAGSRNHNRSRNRTAFERQG